MVRILSALYFFALLTILGCKKEAGSDESILYGIWVKGTNAGDTLRFYKSNGRNRIAYNVSFNSALPAPVEQEYMYRNNQLSIQLYGTSDFYTIESFKWKTIGKEFDVKGIELFSFMSSTTQSFTYRKIQ